MFPSPQLAAATAMTIQGSEISAGNDLKVKADGAIDISAANNTSSSTSTNKSSSASVGVSYGSDGLKVNASIAGSKGKGDGSNTTRALSHLNAGATVDRSSGGNTSIVGLHRQAA